MKKRKSLIWGGVVLLALASLVLATRWLGSEAGRDGIPSSARSHASSANTRPVTEQPAQPAAAVAASSLNPSRETAVIDLFKTTSDLRTVALLARQRASEGGVYFANVVEQLCSNVESTRIQSIKQPLSNWNADKQKRLDDLVRRCASFIPQDFAWKRSLVEEPLGANDTAFKIRISGLAARLRLSPDERQAYHQAIEAWLANPVMPMLLAEGFGFGLGTEPLSVFVGGKFHPPQSPTAQLVSAAAGLAACDLGDDCSAQSVIETLTCLAFGFTEGACDRSREDVTRMLVEQGTDDPKAALAEVQRLRSEIVAAVRSRNAGYFVPERSSPLESDRRLR